MIGIVIAGPTGVGKTDLSIKLAKKLNADIVSGDSAQIYKYLDIGTAKISEKEMENIKHYMIDIIEPNRKYSVGEFQKDVDNILASCEQLNKNVIIVGGTGLYIKSVTDGLSDLPEANVELRNKYMKMTKEELYEELVKVDKEAANEIHPNNKKRVERALEVFTLTGEKFSVLSKKNIKNNNYPFLKIALERDRDSLYERINKRVDIMIKQGLEAEVKVAYNKYGEILRKINIIGYSEFIDYFNGKITYDQCVELIKKNSRHYAKRQFTWFKNDPTYIWYDLDNLSEEAIIDDIIKRLKP